MDAPGSTFAPSQVNGVAVLPLGHRVVSASGDKALKLWEVNSGACLETLAGHSWPARARRPVAFVSRP